MSANGRACPAPPYRAGTPQIEAARDRPVLRVFLKSAKGRAFPRRHRGEELRRITSGAGRPILREFLMRWLACFWAAASLACAQTSALLSNQDALALERRTAQLMESTGLAVPGLARAGAPALEDARQALTNLEGAPQNAENTYLFLTTARAYLAISDTVPRPYPFPDAARRQFGELRDAVDRLDAHFRALLDLKEAQLRNPDPDELKRYAEANAKLAPQSRSARGWCF